MKKSNMSIYDVLGFLFDKFSELPLLMIILIGGVAIFLQWTLFLKPSFTGRHWSIPTSEQVLHVSGQFSSRISSKSPYEFHTPDGARINLICIPYLSHAFQDCINDSGIKLSSIVNRDVIIGYFPAKDIDRKVNIITDIRYGNKIIMPFYRQAQNLREIAEIEDEQRQYSPVINAAGTGLIAIIVMMAVSQKLDNKKRK